MASPKGPSGRYSGPVEVVVDGKLIGSGQAHLTGRTDMLAAGSEWIEGLKSWDGRLEGVAPFDLIGKVVQLRLPDGRVGDAIVRNDLGDLVGTGDAPFDVS